MNTVDFIGSIVNKMTPTIDILSTVDNGDGTFTITVKNTYWIREFLPLSIGVVTAFTQDVDITVKTTVSPTGSFILQAPFFFHGTPIATNNEWVIKRKEKDKYPLVYVVEPLSEEFQDELSSIEKISSLTILFLDITFLKKDTVENYESSINPLEEMVKFFVDLLENEGLVLTFSHGQKNHVKVGVETTNKGHTSKILNEPLNAIEFTSTLSIMESNKCINC